VYVREFPNKIILVSVFDNGVIQNQCWYLVMEQERMYMGK